MEPPIEYLLKSSDGRLRDFMLARFAKASELRKEIKQLEIECAEQQAEALFASWLLEHGAEIAALEEPVVREEPQKNPEEMNREKPRRLKPLTYEHWRSEQRHARRTR